MKDTHPLSQEKLLAFLLEPRSYRHCPKRVRLIQTHASYVLIAAPYVYKVKKPVNLGFLDFSTLENRRHFSEREVILNRRLCQGIYLGVVPISLNAGRLAFGLRGDAVEYAIKMRKLQDRYFTLGLLQRDRVGTEDLDRVVSKLKAFYEGQRPTEEVTMWGRIKKLKISTDENFRQTEAFIGSTLSRPAFEAIRLYTENFYNRNAKLFDSRIRKQWIRDCHGDLHLEHVHLAPKRLSIYDCIEFNDRFRYIDVANDIAFLAMDFDYHGRSDLSRYFIARLADALGDSGMLGLMDVYKCYRAYVRGKVESLRQDEVDVSDSERRESRARAARYFRLALQYAVCGSEPRVVVLMGRVGSGKSTLASALGRELGWDIFSSDQARKELAGLPLYTRGGPTVRRRLYSQTTTRKTYVALLRNARKQVKERRSLILDATFSRCHYRDQLRQQLDRAGVAYCFVEAQASEETSKKRLEARERKARELSDARLEDFEMLNRSYEPPLELDLQHRITVGTEHSLEATVAETLKALTECKG
jgi:aminoglycoside phosphotransferase family enzyme/predicted kinase